jgi:puromycin-sensitive aminopeptidase
MTTLLQAAKPYRLPTHVLPRRYDIQIDARLGREEFFGKVTIQLDIHEASDPVPVAIAGGLGDVDLDLVMQEPRDYIELHARELQLSDARLTAGDQTLEGRIALDPERQMARIKFDRPLPIGEGKLEISFAGKLSPNMEGIYLAKDGPEQCIATQCEQTEARAIFPCFDEPTFKAQFAWQVTTSPDVVVLANSPQISVTESQDGQSKTWTFTPTKTMSSYLVALVIGDIASTPEEVVNGTPIRVWALRGKESMGQFAHDYTARLLPWFEDYFGVPYHFDKYDQAAVPGFSAGAMENSGLVIFRQNLLIMDPRTASWEQEKHIAKVVAHEFAHMWFGDLVTMRWWDDLWLNEAFAEWTANKVVNALSPDYHVWDDFQSGKSAALSSDALESTHPIYCPVETPAEAAELFDVITYQKGCSVMRMLEHFLGEESFRAGLRTYMKEFFEGNAAGADLWRHLQNASGSSLREFRPVTQIMESWIAQPGYPVIDVSLEGSGGGASLRLSQHRFFSKPRVTDEQNQIWQVPLVVRYEDGTGVHQVQHLLSERQATLPLNASGDVKWVYANAGEIGFYRQNPDDAILKGLLANLDKLTPLEQMGLLGDQWGLVRNATSSMTRFLDVLEAVSRLNNYSVLERVMGHLHTLETFVEATKDEEALKKLRAWTTRSFNERLAALGFEPRGGETQNDAQSRVYLVDAMASIGHDQPAVQQTTQWADREATDPTAVSANLAGLFVAIAAQFGDNQRFERYVQIYQQRRADHSSPQETGRYLNSFPAFRPPELVRRIFDLMDEKIVPQEAVGPLLRQMLVQAHTQVAAWEYIQKNWYDLRTILGDSWIGSLVEASGQLPASLREQVTAFYDKNLGGIAQMSYARAMEVMDQLAEFKERTRDDMLAWFKSH